MRVQRIDEQLAAFNQPLVMKANDILIGGRDCLIVCAGFEDRSLAVLRSISTTSDGAPLIVLIEYRPVIPGNLLGDSLRECARLGVTPIRFIYDRENPAGAADDLWSYVGIVAGRIYLDISGMSRLLIVQLLSAIPTLPDYLRRMSILYAEAGHYHPSQDEFDRRVKVPALTAPIQFLSWGVSQITVVPELASIALEDQPTHLIAFPTFDPQQFSSVRKDVEPAAMTVIHGRPLPAHGDWRMNAIRDLNGIRLVTAAAEDRASTYDYRETVSILLRVYADVRRLQRVVISPTGSKMQTVAVGLVRAFIRDMTIVYPTPRFFKTEAYTTGTKQLHRLDLDTFADLADATGRAFYAAHPAVYVQRDVHSQLG